MIVKVASIIVFIIALLEIPIALKQEDISEFYAWAIVALTQLRVLYEELK